MTKSTMALAAPAIILALILASCTKSPEEKPVSDDASQDQPINNANIIEKEAASIDEAAEQAAALIEAESKAEIKALNQASSNAVSKAEKDDNANDTAE